MNIISQEKLSSLVKKQREVKRITQEELGKTTGINRLLIGRIEKASFLPSIPQLDSLMQTLDFSFEDICTEHELSDLSSLFLRGHVDTPEEKVQLNQMKNLITALKRQLVLRDLHSEEIHV